MKQDDMHPPGVFPEDGSVDSEFLNQLAAEAVEYIHADAKDEVLSAIVNTDDTAGAIGATAYKITRGLLDKHKPIAVSLEADMSHATALATEVVDMLVEVAEAAQPDAVIDTDSVREEALMRSVIMHGEETETRLDDDTREEAQIIYAGMMEDGTADEGLAYVNQRSKQLGLNSNDWERSGKEAGLKFAAEASGGNPLRKGVEQGVRNMEKTAEPGGAPDGPLMGGV